MTVFEACYASHLHRGCYVEVPQIHDCETFERKTARDAILTILIGNNHANYNLYHCNTLMITATRWNYHDKYLAMNYNSTTVINVSVTTISPNANVGDTSVLSEWSGVIRSVQHKIKQLRNILP